MIKRMRKNKIKKKLKQNVKRNNKEQHMLNNNKQPLKRDNMRAPWLMVINIWHRRVQFTVSLKMKLIQDLITVNSINITQDTGTAWSINNLTISNNRWTMKMLLNRKLHQKLLILKMNTQQ